MPHSRFSPGTVIGDRFVLEQLAGSGGMGEVYRARDRVTSEPVAVKLLHRGDAPHAARFLREARVLLFFVLGEAKSAAVASSLRRNAADPTPAALAMPSRGRSVWVLDRAAASLVLA